MGETGRKIHSGTHPLSQSLTQAVTVVIHSLSAHSPTHPLTHSLTDYHRGAPTHTLTHSLSAHCQPTVIVVSWTPLPTDCPLPTAHCSASSFVRSFVHLFVGLLVCWFVGLLVCLFVGLLVCWFVGWLAGWLVRLFVTLEPWNLGTLEPWNLGTLEPWNLGTLELWNLGTLESCSKHRCGVVADEQLLCFCGCDGCGRGFGDNFTCNWLAAGGVRGRR